MKKLEKPLFTELIQVGMAVKDIKESMDRYIRYGIGPWYFLEFNSMNVDNMMLYGKRKDYAMLVAVCPIGDVRFELIEPLTDSIYTDYIDKYGESIIHHLKLGVDDYDFAVDYLQKLGIESIQSGHQLGVKGKNIYNYFETSQSLGFVLEIVNVTEDYIKPQPQYWHPSKEFTSSNSFKETLGFTLITPELMKTTREYSELFGMNEWEIFQEYPGYPANVGFHRLGEKNIKIIESKKDEKNSIFSGFICKYGKGVVHSLAINFDDFDDALKMFSLNGNQSLQACTFLKKTRFAYIDTPEDLNFITELVDDNKKKLPYF